MATLSEMLVKLGLDAGSFSGGLDTAQSKLDSFGSSALKVGGVLSAAVTVPLTALGVGAISAAMELEGLRNGLIAITGSAEEADRQLTNLKEVAKLPGLGFAEAVTGAINLQAVGFSADESATILTVFGNALATVGRGSEDLKEVTRQLGQLASRGIVTSDNLKPLIERVPQLATVMKELWGTIDTEVLQDMGIDSQTFVTMVVTELGKLPPVTGGLRNDFENLRDTMKTALGEIGAAIAPLVSTFVSVAAPAIESIGTAFASLDPSIQTAIVVVGGLVAAIGPLLLLFGGMAMSVSALIPVFTGITAAMGGASLGLVAIGVSAGVAAAAFGGWKLGEWLQSFTTEYKDAETKVQALSDSLAAQGVVIERGNSSLKDWAAEVFKAGDALKAKKESTEAATQAEKDLTAAQKKAKEEQKRLKKEQEKAADAAAALAKEQREANEAFDKYEKYVKDAKRETALHQTELYKLTQETVKAKDATALFYQGLVKVGDETVDYIADAYKLRDSIASIENAARNVKDMMPPFSTAINEAIGLSTPQVNKLGDAMKTLGLDSIAAKDEIATQMAAARDEVLGSSVATDFEKKTAIYKALQAQIEAAKAAGIAIPAEQITLLNKLETDLKLNLPTKLEDPWKNTMTEVSTAITNAAQSIAGILMGTEEGTVMDAFKKLGQGFLSSFIEPVMDYINDLIDKGIKKLIGWLLSETGISGAFKSLGSQFKSIFGGDTPPVSLDTFGGAAGGGGAGGGGGGGGGAAGIATAVASWISAATGVIGVFQQARQENTLNAIEENTRFGMIHNLATLFSIQDVLDVLWTIRADIWENVHTRLEEIRDHLNRIELFSIPDIITAINGGAPSTPEDGQEESSFKTWMAALLGRVSHIDDFAVDLGMRTWGTLSEMRQMIQNSIVPPLNMMATAGGPVVNVYVTLDGKQLTATVATEIVDTLRSGGQQL